MKWVSVGHGSQLSKLESLFPVGCGDTSTPRASLLQPLVVKCDHTGVCSHSLSSSVLSRP